MKHPRPRRLIFVCSGNYYRSRLAEILFNHGAQTSGLAWIAESRGLLRAGDLKGLSDHAKAYLKRANLEHLASEPRNPLTMDVEDLTDSDLVIALCRAEHQPMVEQKFLSLGKALTRSGRIRYWNIYDIPAPPKAIVRLLGGGHKEPSQPPESGTEHIALAVNNLITELNLLGTAKI
ncbi:MAG: hypothetical protein WCI38_01010 [Chthoniobacterales bacterium]|jgi:protein-tyrosine phosphatase